MKSIIKKIIKSLLRLYGLELKINEKVQFNVFNLKGDKRVLVSYITAPFLKKNLKLSHTNILEALTAGNFFKRNGYIVDVVHCGSSIDIDYSVYDIIYGFGKPFENYFLKSSHLNKKTIFYLTGFNPEISNELSVNRNVEVFRRYNKLFPNSSRVVDFNQFYAARLSTFLLILGGQATVNSYLSLKRENMYSVKAFFIESKNTIDLKEKNFGKARRNFLWFGSLGAIHKGLDILLEIFKNRPNDILHICGFQESEMDLYKTILGGKEYSNIINNGFVDVNSDKFARIMRECAFCVFPSISEGGSPALLTIMGNGGLIPIISSNCGLDGFEKYGFVTDEVSIKEFDRLISQALLLDEYELQERANRVKKYVTEEYGYNKYLENIDVLFTKFINEK